MAGIPRSIRVPEELDREIEREIRSRGERDWTTGALSLLNEAMRARRAPGIVFVEGRGGRRAAVAFSGLEVWEIVATWREAEEDWATLRSAYPDLSEAQLRAAIQYYRQFPAEIDQRLDLEEYWTPERVAEEFGHPSGSGIEAG